MKKLTPLFFLFCIIAVSYTLTAQDYASASNEVYIANSDHSSIEEVDIPKWSNVDTIPDFDSKQNKIKITGTIYEKDGVTPAKDVILSIYQTNEIGDFVLVKNESNEKDIYHSATIKTGADGQYTIYTFMPGTTHRSNELKKIHTNIKEPGKEEYGMYAFVFDNDPSLNKLCRNKLAKRGIDNILKFESIKENDINIATKNIILTDNINE
jgi:protocatechuate 3,4-dioxygenase beta subunit